MIPYGKQQVDNDDIEAVVDVLKSDWLTTGPKVKEFEKAVAKYCGSKYAVAFSSGTAALHGASSMVINRGDEAITPPISFLATANCILYNQGKVKFVDINSHTYNINAPLICDKITPKTKAIIPVDLAGYPCNLKCIYKIAKENNLVVIEDASHALGATYNNKKIGSISDMTVFSFHPVKHITTGEGGMVTTNNKEYYEKLQEFRNHGITRNKKKMKKYDGDWYYEMQSLGYNYRITDIQCALGLSQLKKLDTFIKRRKEIVEQYRDEFSDIMRYEPPYDKSSPHLCIIQIENRDKIFAELRKRGIGVQIHYIPIYRQPYYQALGYKKEDYPNAEKYYKHAMSIPLYPSMTDDDVDFVIKNIKELL